MMIKEMFGDWWKARRMFKFPKVTCSKYVSVETWRFRCRPLSWKWKEYYISHEINPGIYIVFFKNGYFFEFGNGEYWEALLSFLYQYNSDIRKTKENWGWTTMDGKSTWKDDWLTLLGREYAN